MSDAKCMECGRTGCCTYCCPNAVELNAALSREAALAKRAEEAEGKLCAARDELGNIANAKRFQRDHFRDDTEFADWAQSRARFTLSSPTPHVCAEARQLKKLTDAQEMELAGLYRYVTAVLTREHKEHAGSEEKQHCGICKLLAELRRGEAKG